MTQTNNDLAVVARGTQQIVSLGDWCRSNLTKDEWAHEVITMFPLCIKFKFHCPKTKLLAVLSS